MTKHKTEPEDTNIVVSYEFDEFVGKLRNRLGQPLPGREAQVKMAPYPVDESRFNEQTDRPARPSGVMVLFYPYNGEIYLPLMKRPTYQGAHSGQVSFPGGKFELSDENLRMTALRETQEEIGVNPDDIRLIGDLSDLFIIASNFKVSPAVGYVREKPEFIPDELEVEEVLEVKLSDLQDESQRGVKAMNFGRYTIHSPYFDVHGHVVWGATAMMLSELLHVIEELK